MTFFPSLRTSSRRDGKKQPSPVHVTPDDTTTALPSPTTSIPPPMGHTTGGLPWHSPPEAALLFQNSSGNGNGSGSTSSDSPILRAFASMPVHDVLCHLNVDRHGLSIHEARARLAFKGPNTLRSHKPPSWFILFLKVIPNPFNLLLIFLALINVAIPPPDWTGFTVLMAMVTISVLVRFWQEYRSGLAVFRLQMSIKTTVRVTRREHDPSVPIPVADLVPGDIVSLSPGDLVPADCLVLESSYLRVGQSQWTGESAPVSKTAMDVGHKTDFSLFDLSNICLMGTGVVSGYATVVILRTGHDALIAAMAKALRKNRQANAFQRGIQHVTWMLIAFMCLMVPIVCVVSATTTGDWGQAALFSVSIAVGLVPEMLPAIVNANLARGAFLLSKKKAIARRLDAVQNLGAMTVLCSDKTGTLTKGEITMCNALDWQGQFNINLFKLALIEATIQGRDGNNMDSAIRDFRLPDGMEIQHTEYENATAIPFDFERRRSAGIVRGVAGGAMLICKGAFEEVFARCTQIETDKGAQALASHHITALKQQVSALNAEGFRVLLVATKQLSRAQTEDDDDDLEELETDMAVHGLLTFIDPPKPDALESIRQLRLLGVDVKVLTGDNLAVAVNVCRALEIVQRQDAIESDEPEALTGADLEEAEDFDAAVRDAKVFAKVTPDQKERIVASLKKQGHAVGMLGDGMNDCLALRRSDVGISVDSAAGAAKDCADFILTDKGLDIIVDSVTIGRITHANSIKYTKMVLSSNFGNVFSILAASAWLPFTPMINLQILAQNLLYDISQIAIPWDNVDAEFVASPKKWQPWDLLRFVVVLGPTSSVIDICTFLLGWFYYGIRKADDVEAVRQFQTHWFLQGLLTQTLIVHLLRTARLPFVQSRSSTALGLSTTAIMTIGFALPWIPAFQSGLSFVNPRSSYVGFLVAELFAYCVEVQIVKMMYVKLFKKWL